MKRIGFSKLALKDLQFIVWTDLSNVQILTGDPHTGLNIFVKNAKILND